jgi:hypothetical protein
MAGTAFFLALRSAHAVHVYLVTAKHCVQRAEPFGHLAVRLNKNEGGSEVVRLPPTWHFAESEADDVAVQRFPSEVVLAFDIQPFEIEVWCLSDEVIEREGIGVGEDVIAIGLFTHRDGRHENRPIVRSGVIAAMPDEPLEDPRSGLEYDAYLVEIRSIGGLSGSPVIAMISPGREHQGKFSDQRTFWMLGLVRGHWPKDPVEFADFGEGEGEGEQLNTGIAIVTPIQKAVEVIMTTEELVKERKRIDRERA